MRSKPSFLARTETGLTLIELIVAVALLAILAVMAYRGLDSITRAGARTQAETERWRAISMFFERFGADVGRATRRPIRAGDGSPLPEWMGQAFVAANDAAAVDKVNAQLEFTRKSPSGSDEIRLGYRFNNNRVELLIWRTLDRAPSSVADIYPLLDGVKAMRLAHLDKDGAWHDAWPIGDRSQLLPRAIAIELTLGDDTVYRRVFALP